MLRSHQPRHHWWQPKSLSLGQDRRKLVVASLLLVAMPGAPSSVLATSLEAIAIQIPFATRLEAIALRLLRSQDRRKLRTSLSKRLEVALESWRRTDETEKETDLRTDPTHTASGLGLNITSTFTTSKAPVTTSVALVTTSFLLNF